VYDYKKIDAFVQTLNPFEQYCTITVALKISDDSCKMDTYEKSLFMALYEALPKQTALFDEALFSVITEAQTQPTAHTYAKIKILREDAMEMITRPKMKAFKSYVRENLVK
jgi:hypothetical protein